VRYPLRGVAEEERVPHSRTPPLVLGREADGDVSREYVTWLCPSPMIV
jgi:hypothetical protein